MEQIIAQNLHEHVLHSVFTALTRSFSKEGGILCHITKIVQADAKRNCPAFSSDPT